MNSRAFYLFCVLCIVFSIAFALDTCASEGVGPCIGGFCPSSDETCINNDICCLTSEVNVPADQAQSQGSWKILNF